MVDIVKLEQRLSQYNTVNNLMGQYYDGSVQVFNPNISLPPTMRHIRTVVGWPGTCVDVLEERLDFLGWDDTKLDALYQDNAFSNESSMSNLDCLIHGTSYFSATTGNKDSIPTEPDVLMNAESPATSYGVYNPRTRLLDIGFTKYGDEDGQYTTAAVYETMQTTYYARNHDNDRWRVVKVDPHRLRRCQLVKLVNRARAGRMEGRSEITRAVRSYTNTAVRTLLGMETNREFFSAPQRYVLGAKDDAFVDQDGAVVPGWKAILGSLWTLQRDAEWAENNPGSDGLAKVGQFPVNPPGPYLEQIKGLSMLLAAEIGMPPSYLGMVSDNPPSADSIRALETRLVKRAERRQDGNDPAYVEMGILATMLSGSPEPKASDIETMWRDAATPTRSADADRASKLVGAGIVPADSRVAYELSGLTPRQIRSIEEDKAKIAKQQAKDQLRQAALAQTQPGVTDVPVPPGQAPQPPNAKPGIPPVGK